MDIVEADLAAMEDTIIVEISIIMAMEYITGIPVKMAGFSQMEILHPLLIITRVF